MLSAPLAPEFDFSIGSKTLIWIPKTDAKGTVADPLFAKVAYDRQNEFFRYRAEEFADPAARADLLEQAVFRASKAKTKAPLEDRQRYLFRTYQSLVDEAIAGTVKTIPAEPFVFESLTAKRNAEQEIYDALRKREALEAMPEDSRTVWEKRILGFTFDEIAEELHESADTLNMRARRGVKEAIERLFGNENR
jgi:DNA-directed RNA polymerase specialized sigma24 family protein